MSYTAPNAREAQQICTELTSLMMNENLKSVQAAAKGTSDVLSKGIEDAKRNLDDLDSKLAAFKKQYIGTASGRRRQQSENPDGDELSNWKRRRRR